MKFWTRRRTFGSAVFATMAVSLAVCFGLAALHYYEKDRLTQAARIIRDVGRARDDLSLGFLHAALSGEPGRPWQREQGQALLSQALRDFERAALAAHLEERSAETQDGLVLEQFHRDVQRFRNLLQMRYSEANAGAADVDVRLALHNLHASTESLDALLRADFQALQAELNEAFLAVLAGSVLLLGGICLVLYRLEHQRLSTLQLLESISESSTDAIFAKDTSGRYLFLNGAGARLVGKSAEHLLGHTDRDILPAREASTILANDSETMKQRQARTYEEVVSTVDGPRTLLATKGPLLDAASRVQGVFGISRDITDRKLSEKLLEESRAKLETIIESLHEGLIIFECETGEAHWNRAALSMHGYASAHEQTEENKRIASLFELSSTEGEVLPFDEWPLNRVRRGEAVAGLVLRVRRPGSDFDRFFSFAGTLVRGSDEQPRFALVSISDVTLTRRAEESLRQAQRLEALGTLSAGVAHDFNNILFAIIGNTQLAQLELPDSSPALEYLEEIRRAGARATDLVRRILLFARTQEPRRRSADLGAIVEEALKLLRPTLPVQIQVETHWNALTRPVRVDALQIHQVVTNLVTNAAYAVTRPEQLEAARIEISVEQIRSLESLHFQGRTLPPGEYAHLLVKDNGSGMDEATLQRVFDPFFTTKPVGEGTGLGLSMVHGIVSNHEGAIAMESRPGAGTSIHVYLPLGRDGIEPEARAEARTAARSARILFLDDEPALVRMAERGLARMGHTVTGFINPQQALLAFEERPEAFDVVVSDLSMPELSGFDVAQRMFRRRPGTAIIMMSGFMRPEDRERARDLGIRELLVKPASLETLASAIERARAGIAMDLHRSTEP